MKRLLRASPILKMMFLPIMHTEVYDMHKKVYDINDVNTKVYGIEMNRGIRNVKW